MYGRRGAHGYKPRKIPARRVGDRGVSARRTRWGPDRYESVSGRWAEAATENPSRKLRRCMYGCRPQPVPSACPIFVRLTGRNLLDNLRENANPRPWTWGFTLERVTRIELALSAWEAWVFYRRLLG
ncbi:hypothetical protein GCM10027074_34380 [Streptomyces deserti]